MRFALSIVVLGVLAGAPGAVHAQWQPGGAPVCTAPGNQSFPAIVADGEGGVIIVWTDNRDSSATGDDIYAQRVNADGVPLWAADGVAVCVLPTDQLGAHMTADGVGGVIIVWHDDRNGPRQLYAQRLDAFGVPQWPADGVLVSTGLWPYLLPTPRTASSIASDGAGGAVIAWKEYVTGFDWDVYAQRVGADGSHPWGPRGVAISVAYSFQENPAVAVDGLGGAVIAWEDWREHPISNIYAQRVDGSGARLWTSNGVRVSGAGRHFAPRVLTHSPGRVVIAWEQNQDDWIHAIRVQRLDPSGVPEWIPGGVDVATAAGRRYGISLVPDGQGGINLTWTDERRNPTCLGGCTTDAYSQRVDSLGNVLWALAGVRLHETTERSQYSPHAVSDGAGGMLVAWLLTLNDSVTDNEIMLQHVDAGLAFLAPDGIRSESPALLQAQHAATSDGAGGAIVTWVDDRNGVSNKWSNIFEGDIFAARMPSMAQVNTGEPRPTGLPLAAPRPNPMRSATEIAFRLNSQAGVSLEVFDVAGHRVRTLAARQEYESGTHRLLWDGQDDAGRTVATGIYLIRLAMGERVYSQRVIVLR